MTLDLFSCRMNKFSQNGEDGIIERLLIELGIGGGFFVEFGAWDGKHLSNTYSLIEKGWSGCLIEGDEEKFKLLCHNIPSSSIIKVKDWVRPAGPSSLESILQRNGISTIDILSIDIDSDDLAIWQSVRSYWPSIVIIEYNPTIPFDTRYVNPQGSNHGNSALSIFEYALSHGYALVAGTDTNLIFVKRDLLQNTSLREVSLQEVRDKTFQLRYFFSYEGKLLHTYEKLTDAGITELFPVPWAFTFATQPLPRVLRRGFGKISLLTLSYSFVTSLFQAPIELLRLTRHLLATLTSGRSFGEMLSLMKNKDKITSLMKDI